MRKIRQNNDIDIKVYIKDKDANKYLDPTSCRDISIRLQTASKKVPITNFVLSSEGHIDFRFHAKDQTRIGVYTIVISATTDDGRVFTTDVCDAFALVACSCETGGESEIKVETLNLTAEFAITAWDGADEERIKALEQGKQDKIEDLAKIREGAKLGATALQEYYDDGSHEVVPVKHPDLSTQPSILPYKFNSNYVYEQMFYVESGVNEGMTTWDKTICELPNDFLLLEMFGQIEKADGSVMVIAEPFPGTPGIYFTVSLDGNKLHAYGVGNDFKSAWFRVVWTTKPKAGGYYYSRDNYNLYINAPQDCTFSFASLDNTFSMIEGKVPDAMVERFITEDNVALFIQPEDSSQMKRYTIRCSETSEAHLSAQSSFLVFIYTHNTYGGVVSLEYSFPQAAERLKKGEKTTFNVNIEYE